MINTDKLLNTLGYLKEPLPVVIRLTKPFTTMGPTPYVEVGSANAGFDWDKGRFFIYPDLPISLVSDTDHSKVREVNDKLSQVVYENYCLSNQNKKLKQMLKELQG